MRLIIIIITYLILAIYVVDLAFKILKISLSSPYCFVALTMLIFNFVYAFTTIKPITSKIHFIFISAGVYCVSYVIVRIAAFVKLKLMECRVIKFEEKVKNEQENNEAKG